jgi:hypothetical protein
MLSDEVARGIVHGSPEGYDPSDARPAPDAPTTTTPHS